MSEIERQKRVLNMMITAHSILRDRYNRLSALFENSLLISSVILNAFVFIDAKFITKFTLLTEDEQKLICGIFSIIVFAISIVLLQVKWKAKAEEHAKGATQLFILLQELRSIIEIPDENDKMLQINEFKKKYTQISSTLTQIPDNQFNKLKLKHTRKVELSKLIDKYPAAEFYFLK